MRRFSARVHVTVEIEPEGREHAWVGVLPPKKRNPERSPVKQRRRRRRRVSESLTEKLTVEEFDTKAFSFEEIHTVRNLY